jgi:hypothetical protein
MSDTQPMQADGGGSDAAKPDGVNNAHGDGNSAYPYPNGVKGDKDKGGFFGHGGQTDIAYSGPEQGDDNANAATK